MPQLITYSKQDEAVPGDTTLCPFEYSLKFLWLQKPVAARKLMGAAQDADQSNG